jgi:hypothetical protein
MKKIIPAIIAILIIPFAIACKKNTNSTGTVTNGVARVELTISPAIDSLSPINISIMNNANTSYIAIRSKTVHYVSDDYSVTEGQNFIYYLAGYMLNAKCYTITGDIYYNNVKVSTKTFDFGNYKCKDGYQVNHNAIVQ